MRRDGIAESAQSPILLSVILSRRALRILAAALLSATAAKASLWVSAAGSDGNPGTEERPFRTLERAREFVRTLNADMSDDITVFISGTHRLASPVVFGPGDSASNGFSIVYTAAPGEHPVVTGAFPVAGWACVERTRNLWAAPAPEVLLDVRDLYVNGFPASRTLARIARLAAAAAPMPAWHNPEDVLTHPPGRDAIWSEREATSLLFVENTLESLNRPGQAYFDRQARRIYYIPRTGEDLATAQVEAAAATTLIYGAGSGERALTGLIFKGIRFEHTSSLAESAAAVHLTRARSVQFLEDTFAHLADAALELGPQVEAGTVEGCTFGDIAGTAVTLAGASHVTVTQSRFSYVATRIHSGSAIHASDSQDVEISHVQVDHFPNTAIVTVGEPAGAVRSMLNRIGPPQIGIDRGLPEAPSGAGDADGPGISPSFEAAKAESFSLNGPPEPPSSVSAEPEDGFAYVTWNPPCADGGQPVSSYLVSASTGASLGVPAEAFRSKGYVVFGDLAYGRPVAFTVIASNALGRSPPSLASTPVVPSRKRHWKAAQPPSSATLTVGAGWSRLQLAPPPSTGGSPVVAYVLTLHPSGARFLLEGHDVIHSEAAGSLVFDIPGLSPDSGATVAVSAVTAKGEGEPAPARVLR